MQTISDLTIVIPLYRKVHLFDLLTDLCNQTNQSFKLLIVTDGVSADFEPTIEDLINKLDTTVIEFAKSIGREDPSRHWDRALRYCETTWVWMIGDDDRISSNCVEVFYSKLKEIPNEINICRFPVAILNNNKIIRSDRNYKNMTLPVEEYLKRRLKSIELSFASEYVIKLEKFSKIGGFVSFPFAWCSDDATWIQLAFPNGIFLLNDGEVFWRESSGNTSSKLLKDSLVFSKAESIYALWLVQESNLHYLFENRNWRILLSKWFIKKTLLKNSSLNSKWIAISNLSKNLEIPKLKTILMILSQFSSIKIWKFLMYARRFFS